MTAVTAILCESAIVRDRMFKKSIAAALLMVILVWAEVALAPMILMRAGHLHQAREIPGHVAQHLTAHHHTMPAGHPCCPGIGKTETAPPSEFAANSSPCQNERSCCSQPGPQSVPAPVRTRSSQQIAPAQIAELSSDRDAESHTSPPTALAPGPPPGQFGMILRV